MKSRLLRGILALVSAGTVGLLSPSTGFADNPHSAPLGLDKLIVYMADGLYDPMTPFPDQRITNCDPMLNMCDGTFFQKEILGRSQGELDAAQANAKAFFKNDFGLDVDDPAMASRLMFRMFQIDPRVNYHVATASGEHVPSEGWPVYFGGWLVAVVDPNGVDLGGKQAGVHTGFGGMLIYGENVIDTSRWPEPLHVPKRSRIVIHYQSSGTPFVPAIGPAGVGDSALMFKLDLLNEHLGMGRARGRGEIIPQANGLIKMDIVSVLTFPSLSEIPAAR